MKFEFGYTVNGKLHKKKINAKDEGSANLKVQSIIMKEQKRNPDKTVKMGFLYDIC